MAKIQEEILLVKLSRLIKDTDEDNGTMITADLITGIEQLAQELVSSGVVVELDIPQ